MDHRESTIFRLRVLAGIFLAIMAIFLGVLYNTQVNDYDEYYASSIRTIARPEEVDAARGDITDRNGKVMVSSRPSYSLTFDASELDSDQDENEAILRLLELCQVHRVNLHWVKGHASNPYNNRCDELAVAESRKFR